MKTQDPMKPVGVWDVRRKIHIPSLGDLAQVKRLEKELEDLPGVLKLATDMDKKTICMRYDASRIDYQSILKVLATAGLPATEDWWSQLKGRWYGFTDRNARDNAHAPPDACCNKPPR